MEATLIYPHQLFLPTQHPALSPGRLVFLAEEPLFLTEFGTHRQKLLLHRLSMQAYKEELIRAGYAVVYLDVREHTSSDALISTLKAHGCHTLHVCDTTDDWLETRLKASAIRHRLTLVRYDTPLFILTKQDAREHYRASKRLLASFYKSLRIQHNILITPDRKPAGGAWSFDAENRKKLPKNITLPTDITFYENPAVQAAQEWLSSLPGEQYGEATVWLPYDRAGAELALREFLATRFAQFGPYEDAIHETHTRLFHSALSPLLNIGLLDPRAVIATTLAYADTHTVPLPSLEGFIRQILGWREFIRAAYETDGRTMRTKNFLQHHHPLPPGVWNATTGLAPLDATISRALASGYTHHIERLMVAGNYFLLTETSPDEVYRWFMAMYVDAYDWVMVPNVYGMSQYADGGLFATKPYIAGGNYLKKMSAYPAGSWEYTLTSLYWHFIKKHETLMSNNHRLSMMPRLLAKMDLDRRTAYLTTAEQYLTELHKM